MSRLLLLTALATLAASPTLAQTCSTEWTNPAGGLWSEGSNWTNGRPGTAPNEGGLDPCITLAGTYTITLGNDTAVSSLILGGTSGVQTLTTANVFNVSGNVTVRPNGRWAFQDRTPGGQDGLYATGTVLVEGDVTVPGGVTFLANSGTLDVAPGGTFRVSGQASVGGINSLFRVRGTIEGVGCPVPNTGECQIAAPLEVLGGTLRAADGVLRTSAGGTMNGATLDAGPAGFLALNANAAGPPYLYTVEGTLQGAPEGYVAWSSVRVAAGPAGATFAVGGTGLQLAGSSTLASGGGSFTNTGLLREAEHGSNFSSFNGALIRNTGTVEFPSGFEFYNGAVLRNEPGGTVWFSGAGGIGPQGSASGRIENAGLLLRDGNRPATGTDVTLNGLLRSLPGSEIRILGDTRLSLDAPGSRTLPDGATLTGDGAVGIPGALEPEGTLSPGTEAEPLATLTVQSYFRPSLVAGSPRLVIDVDAGGQSDRLDVLFAPGSQNTRLGGALVVRVRPGYTPQAGDAFTILTSGSAIEGQFAQVVAQDAPGGIAFVTEVSADGLTLTLRAVAVAPGGPITVSTTTPVAGGVRSLFLTGPGAPGVTAARLDCTECLDPDRHGRIDAVVVGTGTLREARFDLTSTRVFGAYDLVLQRPGQPDEVVPVTVRPFLSFAQAVPVIERGIGVRPAGLNYNWSQFDVRTATNADEPTYALGSVGVEDAAVEYAIASGNTFGIGARVLYESGPGAPAPLLFGRIPSNGSVPLTFGQRIDPADVRFPEQASTGPNDARIPFGADRVFATVLAQHASYERMRRLVVQSLRESGSARLGAYLGQVDAADAGAVDDAVGRALQARSSYVDVAQTLFDRLVATLGETVAPPSGLDAEAGAFDAALDRGAEDFLADVTLAHLRALDLAPASVQALFDAEVDALTASSARLRGDDDPPITLPPGLCESMRNMTATSPARSPLTALSAITFAGGSAPYTPGAPTLNPIATESTHISQSFRAIGQNLTALASSANQIVSSIGSAGAPPRLRAGAASRGGFGGGTSCSPPAAPADPNDKSADTALLCEFGTVTVDGEEVSRCVRHFVPLADAAAPIVYTIQFENLPQATAPAEFVTITDELDPNLDPATLRVLATSSDSTFSMSLSGRTATFRFIGIDLPPNVTAPEGQGFVTFSVAPVAGLAEGTVIENDADIVFDFNPAIATPAVTHEIRRASDLAALITEAPDVGNVGVQVPVSAGVVNQRGDRVEDATLTLTLPAGVTATSAVPTAGECSGTSPVVCAFGALEPGQAARVDLVLDATSATVGEIRAVASTTAFDALSANDADVVSLEVRPVGTEAGGPGGLDLLAPAPNPARGTVVLRLGVPSVGPVRVTLYDARGRLVAVVLDGERAPGWVTMQWDASELASGVYVVRAEAGGQMVTRTLTVVR